MAVGMGGAEKGSPETSMPVLYVRTNERTQTTGIASWEQRLQVLVATDPIKTSLLDSIQIRACGRLYSIYMNHKKPSTVRIRIYIAVQPPATGQGAQPTPLHSTLQLPASRDQVLEDALRVVLLGSSNHFGATLGTVAPENILGLVCVVHVDERNVDIQRGTRGFDLGDASATCCVKDRIVCCVLPGDVEEEDWDLG